MNANRSTEFSWSSYLSLFTSVSTLLCCAIPSVLVMLGMGSVVVSIVGQVPWLVTLSENKAWVFGGSGLMLLVGGIWQRKAKDHPCPIDVKQKDACMRARRFSLRVYLMSLALYLIGAATAFGPLLFGE